MIRRALNPEGDDLDVDYFEGFCEVKDGPEKVLEEVDLILANHGLEVIIFETGDTSTPFKIGKRNTGKLRRGDERIGASAKKLKKGRR